MDIIENLITRHKLIKRLFIIEERRLWQLLSAGLLFMSCDEVAQIHEHLGNTINKYFLKCVSIRHSAWVVILGPAVLLIIFMYIFGAFILEATINLLNVVSGLKHFYSNYVQSYA